MKTILPLVFIFLSQVVYGQSTKDVIESPRTKEGNVYFDQNLKMTLVPGKVPFSLIKKGQIISVKKSADSESEINAHERTFKVYVKTYNPLNYSFNSTATVVVDSVNYRLNAAIEDMWETLDAYNKGIKQAHEKNALLEKGMKGRNLLIKIQMDEGCPYDSLLNVQLLDVLKLVRLEQQRSKDYIDWSRQLIALDFLSKSATTSALSQMETNLNSAKKTYVELYAKLDSVRTDILKKLDTDENKIVCALSLEVWLTKTNRIKDLVDDQKKYLDNFEQLHQKVQKEVKSWKSHEADDTWFILVKDGVVSRDSSALVTLKMTKHLMSIDEKGQIKQADSEEIAATSVQFMWHRTFVPEVSAGVYYSLQSQDSYRMRDDGAGAGTVVQIGQRAFEGIAISSMLNFYLNKRDWKVLPFWQVGLGLQKEMPLFMCGLGARFGLKDRAFSVACGLSLTAIKGLDDLDVGDAVTDEAEIENDLRYQFSVPKLYFGIQFHF